MADKEKPQPENDAPKGETETNGAPRGRGPLSHRFFQDPRLHGVAAVATIAALFVAILTYVFPRGGGQPDNSGDSADIASADTAAAPSQEASTPAQALSEKLAQLKTPSFDADTRCSRMIGADALGDALMKEARAVIAAIDTGDGDAIHDAAVQLRRDAYRRGAFFSNCWRVIVAASPFAYEELEVALNEVILSTDRTDP